MQPSEGLPLVLPPALTYVLARGFDAARARRGDARARTRLEGVLRDAVRYLAASGATTAEIHAALGDVCAVTGAWHADPDLHAGLAELEQGAHAFAALLAASPPTATATALAP